jgi:hypothetical protein
MSRHLLVLLLLLGAPVFLVAGDKKPKRVVFADVTERGRMLYQYDQAAWHGTDAVLAMHPPKDWHPRYIARRTDAGWTLVFGVLDEKRDHFNIVYEAVQGTTLQNFTAVKLENAREDTGFYFAAAKSINSALKDFRGEQRPYNVAVLPAAHDQFYVYVFPAQVRDDVYPLGGDVRYLTSADGDTIIERRQLHKAIIEISPSSIPKGTTAAGGYHTHVLTDVPEDTDVFHVLSRKPPQPEFIGTPNKKFYEIGEDGTIRESKL